MWTWIKIIAGVIAVVLGIALIFSLESTPLRIFWGLFTIFIVVSGLRQLINRESRSG
ncbi:hypothetical protein Kisp02_55820 [Kineosporia sp. NBRC 101731]|nr:hypothetical protein Kisp02_55820 [Kineosporia sp. NBRC 101731]